MQGYLNLSGRHRSDEIAIEATSYADGFFRLFNRGSDGSMTYKQYASVMRPRDRNYGLIENLDPYMTGLIALANHGQRLLTNQQAGELDQQAVEPENGEAGAKAGKLADEQDPLLAETQQPVSVGTTAGTSGTAPLETGEDDLDDNSE